MPTMLELEAVAARSKITRARINMLLTQPFFGALVMKLEPVAREQKAPLSTDGRKVFFNPRLIDDWSNARLLAGLAHEVFHCALGHPWRMGDRDPELWNVAADHVVNLRLKAEGFDIGPNWLADPQFVGLGAEVVYSRLQRQQQQQPQPQQQQQPQQGGGQQQPQQGGQQPPQQPQPQQQAPQQQRGDEQRPGDVEPPQPDPDHSGSEAEQVDELDAQWRQAVQEAAVMTQGEGSGAMAQAVDEAKRARIDWRAELRRKLAEISRDDYTWRHPNQRYIARGLYMPSLRDEKIGTVVIVRDTSGSITAAELAKFNAEVAAIIGEVKPTHTYVMDCDAAVRKVWDIEAGDDLPDLSKAHGRGGTDFRPPFRWLEKEGIEPRVLVYLTDMAGTFPTDAPPFDVVWCATSRDAGPFGETLPLNG